jgi:hypothetical protein
MLLVLAIVLAYPLAISTIGCLFLLPLLLASLLLGIFMWKWLPETKGLPVDEIFRNLTESNSSSPKPSTSTIGTEYGTMNDMEQQQQTTRAKWRNWRRWGNKGHENIEDDDA